MKGFLKHGLSIDEFRVSSLVVSFIIIVGFALYKYWTTGDITANVTDLIKTLGFIIGGVNAVNGISTMINKVQDMSGKTKPQQQDNSHQV